MRIGPNNVVAYFVVILYESLRAFVRGLLEKHYRLASWDDAAGRRVELKETATSGVISVFMLPWSATMRIGALGDVPTFREQFRLRRHTHGPVLLKQVPSESLLYVEQGKGWVRTLLNDKNCHLLEIGFYATSRRFRARMRRLLLEERLRERYGISLPSFGRRHREDGD